MSRTGHGAVTCLALLIQYDISVSSHKRWYKCPATVDIMNMKHSKTCHGSCLWNVHFADLIYGGGGGGLCMVFIWVFGLLCR